MWNMTHSHVCDVARSCINDSFTCGTWLIHMSHDSIISGTWLIPMSRDSFNGTRLIHMCDMSKETYIRDKKRPLHQTYICVIHMFICVNVTRASMGWLRLVASIKLQVSSTEYRLFYKSLLQKRPVILSILLTEATPYTCEYGRTYSYVWLTHMTLSCVCRDNRDANMSPKETYIRDLYMCDIHMYTHVTHMTNSYVWHSKRNLNTSPKETYIRDLYMCDIHIYMYVTHMTNSYVWHSKRNLNISPKETYIRDLYMCDIHIYMYVTHMTNSYVWHGKRNLNISPK